jgi:hypothetical protein
MRPARCSFVAAAVMPEADGRSRQLDQHDCDVPVEGPLQRQVARELAPERDLAGAQRSARAPHHRAKRRRAHAQGHLRSEHPFAAHHADLDARASVKHRHERNEAVEGKVHVPGRHGRLADDLAQHQADRLADREQATAIVAPENFDEVVLDRQARPFRGGTKSARRESARLSATVRRRSFATRPRSRCGSAQTPSCLNATRPRSSY